MPRVNGLLQQEGALLAVEIGLTQSEGPTE